VSRHVAELVLLASAVIPALVVIVLVWLFLRARRRHDERERHAAPERMPQ